VDVGDAEMIWELKDQLRLRVSCFRSARGPGAVFRIVPSDIPTLEDLGLPRIVARLATYHQGLALIAGAAGSGKTSTVAALVNLINEERKQHIIILEELIEFVHKPINSNVIHRQIPEHSDTFAGALKAAFREDPDVIVIGEMRDLETISLAMSAAETGHLVLATVHTTDCVGTIDRIIGAYPYSQQAQIRAMLSESLRGIVSQKLVLRADNMGRVPAVEVVFNTPGVAQLIRSGTTFQIPNAIQMGREVGMRQFSDSLARLARVGLIKPQEVTQSGAT
jgi:twitching motility protein PilT